MDAENCAACRFWEGEPTDPDGSCRRYPPTLIPLGVEVDHAVKDGDTLYAAAGGWYNWRFAVTRSQDWCGEFQRKSAEQDAAWDEFLVDCRIRETLRSYLARWGVHGFSDLLRMSYDDLSGVSGFGVMRVETVIEQLGRRGMKLRNE